MFGTISLDNTQKHITVSTLDNIKSILESEAPKSNERLKHKIDTTLYFRCHINETKNLQYLPHVDAGYLAATSVPDIKVAEESKAGFTGCNEAGGA